MESGSRSTRERKVVGIFTSSAQKEARHGVLQSAPMTARYRIGHEMAAGFISAPIVPALPCGRFRPKAATPSRSARRAADKDSSRHWMEILSTIHEMGRCGETLLAGKMRSV